MTNMEAILEPLIRSPKFLGYVDELNDLRRREAQARERFRQTLDEDIRAEFINGEVMVQMTARDFHTTTVYNLARLLGTFVQMHRLGELRSEQALTGFTRNDYAPDICFWTPEKAAAITAKTTVYPVPDFIAEVLSPSTESRDRGVKLEDFAAHGVSEYWIIDPETRTIEQYLLQNGQYSAPLRISEGAICSTAIAGFEMDVNAAFDPQANLVALQKILAS